MRILNISSTPENQTFWGIFFFLNERSEWTMQLQSGERCNNTKLYIGGGALECLYWIKIPLTKIINKWKDYSAKEI